MRTVLRALIGVVAAALLWTAAGNETRAQQAVPPPIVLGSPVDCAIPEVCWVQNYYDHDPGPGAEDYTCGKLAYNKHRGTDFRVANLAVMGEGISVIASADGVVAAIRDGMPDTGIIEATPESIRGRECGNGVSLRHPNGWITQYCHLKSGSIVVEKGQRVAKGEKLGLIGLSGMTEFPHVHLEVKNGKRSVDPFVGFEATGKCGTAAKPLFEPELLAKSGYVETGLLNAGFTDTPPKGIEILRGEHVNETLPTNAPALIYWVELFGTQPGDRAQFTIFSPDGSVMVQQTHDAQPGYSARRLAFSGRRRPQGGWPAGEYRGVYRLLRDQVGETKVAFELEKTIIVGSPQVAAAAPAAQPPRPAAPAETAPPQQTPETAPPASNAPPPATRETTEPPQTETAAPAAAAPATQETTETREPGVASSIADRAAELLPIDRLPAMLRSTGDQKGPPPWLIAAGLLLGIFGMVGVAYITRR